MLARRVPGRDESVLVSRTFRPELKLKPFFLIAALPWPTRPALPSASCPHPPPPTRTNPPRAPCTWADSSQGIKLAPRAAAKLFRELLQKKGMPRGNRDASSGILKNSMRDNYTEHGVDEVSTICDIIATRSRTSPPSSTTRRLVRHTATRTSLGSRRASTSGSTGTPSRALVNPSLANSVHHVHPRWWRMRQPHIEAKKFMVFDMACGSSGPLSLPYRLSSSFASAQGGKLQLRL